MPNRATHREWQDLATLDPLFAVLSHPGTRGGGWDEERFFATGAAFVERVLSRASEMGRPLRHREALDFGCGVGRLARWLAPRFETCLGLDVAPGMIAEARRLNAGWPTCRFEVVPEGGLSTLPERSFDLVLTKSVLQHFPDRRTLLACVSDLMRLVADGGLLLVHVPARLSWRSRLQLAPRLYRLLRAVGAPAGVLYDRVGLTPIRMRAADPRDVLDAIRGAGGRLLGRDTRQGATGDDLYYATR